MSGTARDRISYAFAKEHGALVLADAPRLRIGVRDGADPLRLLEVRRALGQTFDIETLGQAAFDRALSDAYAGDGIGAEGLADGIEGEAGLASLLDGIQPTADLLDTDDNAPIIKLINGLIAEAVRIRASDIHVEPYEDRLAIRFRVDGVLREMVSHSRRAAPLIASRVKVMARLDIAEKRLPQDGRISLTFGGRNIDVRVSTLPSRFGERVVMRLLDKDASRLDLDVLGMDEGVLAELKRALAQPNGILLVSGPTGSGKTTTLYAGVLLLNDKTRNILTVEDPIEYGLDGVGQTQVNPKVGMTFASGLRAILRQDPDVVMVGEIRDAETAQIAIQASLTGHLVLSTVHTNSAAAAVTRLRDMGVEPFLLASTLTAVLAQRLVRRLCPSCRAPHRPDTAELTLLGLDSGVSQLWTPRGCERCSGTGYQGRLGIYEIMVVDDEVRRLIHEGARESDIAAYAARKGSTLMASGAHAAAAGLTSAAEVLRVCRAQGDGDGGV